MSDPHRLARPVHDAIYLSRIAPRYYDRSTQQIRPCAIFTGGQPGSGKSGLAALAIARFRETGYVLADADKVRQYHPAYETLMAADDRIAANLTQPDAAQWASRLVREGVEGRRNIVIDQTSRDPAALASAAAKMRANGHRVELHVMATPALVSTLRIHQRYEGQRAVSGNGRFSTKDRHDEAFEGVATTVAAVEAGRQVDRLCLYDYNCTLIYDNELTQGQWRDAPNAAGVLQAERSRLLSPPEAAQIVRDYAQLCRTLARPERQATLDERAAVQAGYDAAQRLQARSLLGNHGAQVRAASSSGVYVGAIVGETPTHWIQRLSPSTAILHDKAAVSGVAIGQAGTLRYRQGQAQLTSGHLPQKSRGLSR